MSGDPGSGPAAPVIELWQEPDRRWRWRYLEPSDDGLPRAFRSNKEYDSREAALSSATTAYPGVAVLQPRAAAGPARRRRGRLLVLAVVGAVALVLWPRRRRRRARRR